MKYDLAKRLAIKNKDKPFISTSAMLALGGILMRFDACGAWSLRYYVNMFELN